MAVRFDGLGPRGAAVYRALVGVKPDGARKALAVEAGRMADRLEQLNTTINGDEHLLKMMHFRLRFADDDMRTVDLVLDKALAEARQLQLAYATVVKTLSAAAGGKAAPVAPEVKDPVDDIAARRAARRAAASS